MRAAYGLRLITTVTAAALSAAGHASAIAAGSSLSFGSLVEAQSASISALVEGSKRLAIP
jgi:hypothetical protein